MIYNLRKKLNKSFPIIQIIVSNQKLDNLPETHHPTLQEKIPLAQLNQIEWVECEDVYKPTEKPIQEFMAERGISSEFNQVYILEEALTDLTRHLEADVSVEHGGILFGQAYTDSEYGVYVEITAAVAAPATIGTGAYLEFTPDSWQGIIDYAKDAHLETNIVGWYHSHPNIGVFMSGTDMRTQQAFFNNPWCLSIVYDPVKTEIGYFLGKKAKVVKPVIFSIF